MIHLYTGDGKGKTSAAIGLCIRAAGWERRICFAQFMKGNATGELLSMEKLQRFLDFGKGEPNEGIELALTGRDAEKVLRDAADYITEMKCVRHPFEKGVKARKGIEF